MKRILNFGSLNTDYVYKVDHILQGGETIQSESRTVFPGGKGLNQSIALVRAGLSVCHAGLIGTDGEHLRDLLNQNGVDTSLIETRDMPGGHTVIQVSREAQNAILLFGGLFGFVGMIIGVPVFAVIYDLIRQLIIRGLELRSKSKMFDDYQHEYPRKE